MSSHPDMLTPHAHYDVILVVGGEKLYVNKEFLASHSPMFETLFFGDFAEKGKEEVEIKDVVFEEFHSLLQVLYRAGKSVDDENAEYILELADRFHIAAIVEECITHFLRFNSTTFHLPDLIRIADDYRLAPLMTRIIGISHENTIRTVQGSPFFSSLSDETKDLMVERLLSIIEEHKCPLSYRSPSY